MGLELHPNKTKGSLILKQSILEHVAAAPKKTTTEQLLSNKSTAATTFQPASPKPYVPKPAVHQSTTTSQTFIIAPTGPPSLHDHLHFPPLHNATPFHSDTTPASHYKDILTAPRPTRTPLSSTSRVPTSQPTFLPITFILPPRKYCHRLLNTPTIGNFNYCNVCQSSGV